MSSSSKRTISFTVKTEAEKQLYERIARMQGFIKVSDLARVAFMQHIRRYKLIQRVAVQRGLPDPEKTTVEELLSDEDRIS